jgi:hypothetical protein
VIFQQVRLYSVEIKGDTLMMNWEGLGRKPSEHNFKVLFRHLPGRAEKHHGNLIQDSQSPGRDLNWELSEYEAEVLKHSTTTFGDLHS